MDQDQETSRVRIGVVGLGRHGIRYARHIANGDVPNGQLTAVHRRDHTAGADFAREHGCRYHHTVDELLADPHVDAVIITMPTAFHCEATVAAARAGKHVLCEKPMARSSDECARMRGASEESGVKLCVGQTLRYTPVFQALREHLDALGDLHGLRMCIRQERSSVPWHDDPALAGGGAILEIGVHLFDTVHYVTGRRIVRIHAEMRDTVGAGLESVGSGTLWLEGGLVVGFDCAKCVDGRLTRLEAIGESGQLIADATAGSLTRIHGRASSPLETPEDRPAIPPLLEDFCSAILEDHAVPVPPEDGEHAVAVCEAAYRSAREDRPADVNPA